MLTCKTSGRAVPRSAPRPYENALRLAHVAPSSSPLSHVLAPTRSFTMLP